MIRFNYNETNFVESVGQGIEKVLISSRIFKLNKPR
jgi:hypothetical protein